MSAPSVGEASPPAGAVMALTASAMVVSTSMTFTVAVLAPFLIEDGVVDRATLGLLPSCYYLAASAASAPAGALTDLVGGRRSIVVLCSSSAAALLMLATAPNVWVLVGAALLGGGAMALSNPATNLVLIGAFAVGRRGAALGWKQAGVPLSGVLAGVMLPSLASLIGWRASVVAAAALPLLVAVAAGRLLPRTLPATRTRLTGRVTVGSLSVFAYLMGVTAGALNIYLVVYAVDSGWSRTAGGFMAALFSASAALSRVGWALVAERWGRPRLILVGLAGLAAVSIALLAVGPGHWPIWALSATAGAAVLGWQAVAQLTVLAAVPARAAGTASALLMRWFFAGLLSGPALVAWLFHRTGSYRSAFTVLALLAAGAAAVIVVRPPTVGVVDRPDLRTRLRVIK